MHSGYEISGLQHNQQQQSFMADTVNQNHDCPPQQSYHILQQIHTLPTTHQIFQDPSHFQAFLLQQQNHYYHQQRRLNQTFCAENTATGISGVSGSAGDCPVPVFPVNIKMDLSGNRKESVLGERGDSLLRGNEQYDVPETRQIALAMPHCWQNQEDSAIKQPALWETVTKEVSNGRSELEDRPNQFQIMNQKKHSQDCEENRMDCLENKNKSFSGELEAIYKRLGCHANKAGSAHIVENTPVNAHLPNECQGSEASVEANGSMETEKKRRKRKKMNAQLESMANFFERLVKQMMSHQENLHRRFIKVIERLDQERRQREETWRREEMAKMQQEAAIRARENAVSASREAAIVSYLEKITGQTINLPPLEIQPVNFDDPRTELNSTGTSEMA